jgi:hypothetical protein
MTHIICRASNCLFWEEGVCSSEEIEYEPDLGCLAYRDASDLELEDEDEDAFDWDADDDDLFDADDDWEEEEEDDDDWDDL